MSRRSLLASFGLLSALVTALAVLKLLVRSRTVQLFASPIAVVPHVGRAVALTFDDGPAMELVDEIIAILGSRGARATFFVTGRGLASALEAGQRLTAAGHELGNHTFSHRHMLLKSRSFIQSEIESTDTLIRAAGQNDPIYFRPPYGRKLVGLPHYLWRTGRTTIMWSIEPDTYPDVAADPEAIVAHVMARLRPGAIILLHVWQQPQRAASLAALPALIDSLQASGYEVTTVRELLQRSREPRPPMPMLQGGRPAVHLTHTAGRLTPRASRGDACQPTAEAPPI
jgi:peptidoglycan/xylan/chitin deacetylase (PgdA/CDA1 family)